MDDKVRRFLRTFLRFGFFDRPKEDLSIPLYSQEDRAVALKAARESMVVLKNEHVLPLDVKKVRTLAVISPDAYPPVQGGGGSAYTEPFTAWSFMTGLRDELAGKVKVLYASGLPTAEAFFKETEFLTPDGKPGLKMETFPDRDFSGSAAVDVVRHLNRWAFQMFGSGSPAHESIRWSGTYVPQRSGPYMVLAAAGSGDTFRVMVDGREVSLQKPAEGAAPQASQIDVKANTPVKVGVEYRPGVERDQDGFGYASAAGSDCAGGAQDCGCGGCGGCLGRIPSHVRGRREDRSFALPWGQEALINAVAAANPKTIVNVTAGGGFERQSWLPHAAGLLDNFYPGRRADARWRSF